MANALAALRSVIQIGEAAQRSKLSIDTIRFYERQALVPRAPRTMGQFRLYTTDDIARLTFIKEMQGLGFSLWKSNNFSICAIMVDMLAGMSGTC
jgi:hypothetical protein